MTGSGWTSEDERFMARALMLARRGLGEVAPNPSVGCVLVRDGRILARARTGAGGRPHAETQALEAAGAAARGATAYVSLEPCAHHGATPPCADALIAAGIARLVAAVADPDPRTAGRGMARLAEAGIATVTGCLEAPAAELNRGFFLRVREGRPLVTLKLASSLDGRIATRSGASRWITGAAARRHGHLERARHDAILVGSGTLAEDDPRLDCRLPGLEHRSPIRILLGGRSGVRADAGLLRDGGAPVWLVTPTGMAGLAEIEHLPVAAGDDGRPMIAATLGVLAERGITRLLVEGGARIAAAFLRAGLVDRLLLYRAPFMIGGDGLAAVADLGIESLDRGPLRFRHTESRALGEDRLDILVRD